MKRSSGKQEMKKEVKEVKKNESTGEKDDKKEKMMGNREEPQKNNWVRIKMKLRHQLQARLKKRRQTPRGLEPERLVGR